MEEIGAVSEGISSKINLFLYIPAFENRDMYIRTNVLQRRHTNQSQATAPPPCTVTPPTLLDEVSEVNDVTVKLNVILPFTALYCRHIDVNTITF